MDKLIRVAVNGAYGRMGQETAKAVSKASDMELVGSWDKRTHLKEAIPTTNAQVVVDFTNPESVYENCKIIIESGARPVVGTTGLSPDQVASLQELAAKYEIGGVIAPNFSMSAVLLMKFSQMAASYFDYVEIIEAHHEAKKDAPSGTSLLTAEKIAAARKHIPVERSEKIILEGVRGGNANSIPIHSVRMPGYVAAEQVIFGAPGETLTISQNSIHRECFMSGVLLACRKVLEINYLAYGLEHLLDLP